MGFWNGKRSFMTAEEYEKFLKTLSELRTEIENVKVKITIIENTIEDKLERLYKKAKKQVEAELAEEADDEDDNEEEKPKPLNKTFSPFI